jgi:hypothetical protein
MLDMTDMTDMTDMADKSLIRDIPLIEMALAETAEEHAASKMEDISEGTNKAVRAQGQHESIIPIRSGRSGWNSSMLESIILVQPFGELLYSFVSAATTWLIRSLSTTALKGINGVLQQIRALQWSARLQLGFFTIFVRNCRNLQALDLSGCNNAIAASQLQELSWHCPRLTALNIAGSAVNDGDLCFSLIFKNCPSIRAIDLSLTKCGDGALTQIATNCKELQKLKMYDCQVTDAGVAVLAENCPQLIALGFRQAHALTMASITALQVLTKLQILKLVECTSITDDVDDLVVCRLPSPICKLVTSLKGLVSINLRSTQTQDAFLYTLAQHCPHIVSLKLFDNPIRDDGIALITEANFPRLYELSVSSCVDVTTQGLLLLAAQMPRTIEVLYMEGLRHGREGLVTEKVIGSVCKRISHCMTHFFLGNNCEFTDAVVNSIYAKCSALQYLDMDQDINIKFQKSGLTAAAYKRIRKANNNSHVHDFGRLGLVDWFRGTRLSLMQQGREMGKLVVSKSKKEKRIPSSILPFLT